MVKIELIEINRKALSIQNKLITKKKYKTSGEGEVLNSVWFWMISNNIGFKIFFNYKS